MNIMKSADAHTEIARCWRLMLDRIARERDERLRSNLEVVARHVEAEHLGDVDEMMATMVANPDHVFFGLAGMEGPKGYDAIRSMYEASVATGFGHLFEFERVVVDSDSVVFDGLLHKAAPGSVLARLGVVAEGELPADEWYVFAQHLLVVCPITADGLMDGEQVHFAERAQFERPLGDDDRIALGPTVRA